jgi:hypothetical protein
MPVIVIEAEPSHRCPEQFGVHPLRHAAAVLISLDFHQGGLYRASQPRDSETVRVGLLELIHRSVD